MITLLNFLYDKHRNAYSRLLQSAGFQVLNDDQISKNNDVKSFKQLTAQEQNDLSDRLFRMRSIKGKDILQALCDSQSIPPEDVETFNNLFTPIAIQWDGSKQQDKLNNAFAKGQLIIDNALAEWIIKNSAIIEDEKKQFINGQLRPNIGGLSFDNYNNLLRLFNREPEIWELACYIRNQDAFTLLADKISQSNEIIEELDEETLEILLTENNLVLNSLIHNGNISFLPPIAVSFLYQRQQLDTTTVLNYFLSQASNTWDDIKDLISNLLADSSQMEKMKNVYILHNSCDDTNLLFKDFNVSELRNYLDYIKESGSIISRLSPYSLKFLFEQGIWNIDNCQYLENRFPEKELFQSTNRQRQEDLLKWMIQKNEADFKRKRTIIEFYFQNVYSGVSSELFTFLFDNNFYFRCIWPCFGRCLMEFVDNEINNMMNHAPTNPAWENAQRIIRNHLEQ